MPTSIRDLLHAIEREAPYTAGTPRQAADSAWSIGELGRALDRLTRDGLELRVGGTRDEIVGELAASCRQVAASIARAEDGRLTDLARAVADVAAMLRDDLGRDQRWAIAIEVAATIQVVSTYAAEGDRRRSADLAWTHLTARSLTNLGREDQPSAGTQAILDRPLPRTLLPVDTPASRAAAESLVVISDRLRRASGELTRRPTLLEIFAVTRAAESTVRYAVAAGAAVAGRPLPDAMPAAAVWYEVRDRLQPFTTAAPLTVQDRDLGLWAQRAHLELRHEFGPVDRLQLSASSGAGASVTAVRDLVLMANEVPYVADQVGHAIMQLADHGELHAVASRLPFREDRLSEFLANRAVVADRFDVAAVLDRLTDAGKLAAEVAIDLDRAAGGVADRDRPGVLADHQARVERSRRDPHAALIGDIVAGMEAAPRDPFDGVEAAGVRQEMGEEIESGPDFDVE